MGKDKFFNVKQGDFGRFIGTSTAMQSVYEKIKQVSVSDIPVFIKGETGTGKEICAQAIHHYSKRCHRPFIALNCASLPDTMIDSILFGHIRGAYTNAENTREGAIERAQGGTLFLDEICDMPLESQAKLLRFTQEFEYQKLGSDKILKADVRLICATNHNPLDRVQKKCFREDLYYRLHVAPLQMPPLRDRGADCLDIATHFLHKIAGQYNKPFSGFSDEVILLLQSHNWPGNVRELENLIHQIISTYEARIITASMFTDTIGSFSGNSKQNDNIDMIAPLWKIEKRAIEKILCQTSGNVQQAAQILDIAPSTIYRKIQSWQNSGKNQ